ncbi:IS66 family transposase [Bradyrhizobium retamae]|uniref:IS66 family transposase n=1 Tax=Bradyrhizobium retamae TaxID=1300035 RepID=UPI0024C03AAF|nr:transposase [Bradyrhizobium retamae]
MVRETAVDDLERLDARRGHPLPLNHWPGLTRFLDDGRLELDTNPVENAIRPICLTRKNALFAGHDVGASYYSSGDALIKEGDFAADLEISDDAIVWHRLRGTQRLAAGRRSG